MVTYEDFLNRVAEQANLATADAEVVSLTVLDVLGERIPGGEARQLAAELPDELSKPLNRPLDEQAEGFGISEFIRRVAERAGTEEDQAERETRAVLTTLTEVTSRHEITDICSQLPAELRALFG